MGFIHNHEEILGEIIKQRKRRLPGFASVKIAGIVLNALAIADFAHHFDVVQRSLFNALCLKKLVRSLKLVYALPQVVFNLPDCRLQLFLAGCIMRCGEHGNMRTLKQNLSSKRIHLADALDFIPKKFYAQHLVRPVHGEDVQHIPFGTKRPA